MSKHICDCGIGYGDPAALELCQNANHGRPRPPSTDLSDLVAAVQCRNDPAYATFGLGWETIAAFNSMLVAERYMRDCQRGKAQGQQYRTIPIEHGSSR